MFLYVLSETEMSTAHRSQHCWLSAIFNL